MYSTFLDVQVKQLKKHGWTKEAIEEVIDALDSISCADISCSGGEIWCGDGDFEVTFYPSGVCEIDSGYSVREVKTEKAAHTIRFWNGL